MQKIATKKFSTRLAEYRRVHGLTLKQMSEKLGGVSPGFLSEVEREKKKPGSDLVFAFEKLDQASEGEMFQEGKGNPAAGEDIGYRHPDPTIQKVIELLEGMDDNTKEDVCLSVQKEKLLRDLLKEKLEKKAG